MNKFILLLGILCGCTNIQSPQNKKHQTEKIWDTLFGAYKLSAYCLNNSDTVYPTKMVVEIHTNDSIRQYSEFCDNLLCKDCLPSIRILGDFSNSHKILKKVIQVNDSVYIVSLPPFGFNFNQRYAILGLPTHHILTKESMDSWYTFYSPQNKCLYRCYKMINQNFASQLEEEYDNHLAMEVIDLKTMHVTKTYKFYNHNYMLNLRETNGYLLPNYVYEKNGIAREVGYIVVDSLEKYLFVENHF
jgi:hypothetical protein